MSREKTGKHRQFGVCSRRKLVHILLTVTYSTAAWVSGA